MSYITALASTLSSSISTTQAQISDAQTQLATGKKNLNPADSGEVTRLSAQVASYDQVGKNITQANNIISVGQTALSSISSIVMEMQKIATQANNAGLQASDVNALNTTFQSLLTQATNLASGANVNGTNLLDGSANLSVATGIDGTTTSINNVQFTFGASPADMATVNIATASAVVATSATASSVAVAAIGAIPTTTTMTTQQKTAYIAFINTAASVPGATPADVAAAASIGGGLLNGLSVTSPTNAANAITTLTNALGTISAGQSALSASSAGLSAQATSASSLSSNLQSTVDSIQNIDQTALQAKLQQLNNQQSIDYYLVSQMNTAAAAVLTIFR